MLNDAMAFICARSRVRAGVVLSCRLFSSVPESRDGECRDEVPLFRYVGERRKPTDKVFVWGFSFTGALGIPSFVIPDSGRKTPRKYQLTPYRLDTEQKVLVQNGFKTKPKKKKMVCYYKTIYNFPLVCQRNSPVSVQIR